jgi:hypothetical protein
METFLCLKNPHIQDPVDMMPSGDCMMVKSGSTLNLLQDLKVALYLCCKESVHSGLDFSSCLFMTDNCYSCEIKISDHITMVCSFMNSYSQKKPDEPEHQPDLVM